MLRPDRELLQAWLLLFLARGSGYGYGLAEQVRDQALEVEMTVLYRVLRGLERDRQVSSRWIESSVGPRRRLYSLRAKGRRRLDALVLVVTEHRERYDAFVRAYEQAARRRRRAQTRPRTAAAQYAVAAHPERDLLTAWLLLLLQLDRNASYGYDLRTRVAEHGVTADPATVYRLLRRLEADGALRSRWSDPVLGPRRRLYQVTAKGGRDLHEVAAMIARTRDVHDAFADAYDDVNDDYRGPTIPRRTRSSSADERP